VRRWRVLLRLGGSIKRFQLSWEIYSYLGLETRHLELKQEMWWGFVYLASWAGDYTVCNDDVLHYMLRYYASRCWFGAMYRFPSNLDGSLYHCPRADFAIVSLRTSASCLSSVSTLFISAQQPLFFDGSLVEPSMRTVESGTGLPR
jgi:hypothetical protein